MSDLFNQPFYAAAAAAAPARLPETRAENRLRQVLAEEEFEVVLDTVKRWNTLLRTEVWTITALRFTDDLGRGAVTVPVSVVHGIPKPLAEVTSDIEAWQWWIVLHRPVLEQTDRGLQLVVERSGTGP